MTFNWRLAEPLDAVVFDCDGTMSRIEGINELADQNGVGEEVGILTAEAMAHTGVTQALYNKRLSLVRPTRFQVEDLGQRYYEERVPDIENVIDILQRHGKKVFVMSAGLKISVDRFAEHLNIPAPHVYAVDLRFDDQGNFQDYDRQSPLAGPGGKGELIERLKQKYPAIMHVGDGANDLDAKPHVKRFVGYGGFFYRESILEKSDFYVRSASMAPILPLALTEEESHQLSTVDFSVYKKGLSLIKDLEVMMA